MDKFSLDKYFVIKWSVLCLIMIVHSGCKEKPAARGAVTQSNRNIKSVGELRQVLIPGMATNQIVAKLGLPSRVEDLSGGRAQWDHGLPKFPAEGDTRGTYVIGVSLLITNGHLAFWSCIHMSSSVSGVTEILGSKSNGQKLRIVKTDSSKICFYILSDEPVAGGKRIDTSKLPNLGFIAETPNLAIKKLKEGKMTGDSSAEAGREETVNWEFVVSLFPDDTSALASLTASNIGKRVLITVDDIPVTAPKIVAPIEMGCFSISCNDPEMRGLVKAKLASLLPVN